MVIVHAGGEDDELSSHSEEKMQLVIWLAKCNKEMQTDFPEIGKVVFV